MPSIRSCFIKRILFWSQFTFFLPKKPRQIFWIKIEIFENLLLLRNSFRTCAFLFPKKPRKILWIIIEQVGNLFLLRTLPRSTHRRCKHWNLVTAAKLISWPFRTSFPFSSTPIPTARLFTHWPLHDVPLVKVNVPSPLHLSSFQSPVYVLPLAEKIQVPWPSLLLPLNSPKYLSPLSYIFGALVANWCRWSHENSLPLPLSYSVKTLTTDVLTQWTLPSLIRYTFSISLLALKSLQLSPGFPLLNNSFNAP